MSEGQVRRLIAAIAGYDEDQIAPNLFLNKGNGIDAIAFAKVIIRCEQTFHIVIQDEDAGELNTVRKLSRYIDECLADGRSDYRQPTDEDRVSWYYE